MKIKKMTMSEKLIEGAVDSYNTIAKKLVMALTRKDTDDETINLLSKGLKEHRKTIKRLFKDSPSLEIYKPKTRKVLSEIRDNKDIFKTLHSKHAIYEEDIEDYYEGIDYVVEINGEYDLENFLLRRMEAGAIIIGKSLPPQIVRLFDKVKELYMFGAYEATIVFCRALIEETLKKVYQRQHPKTSRRRIDNMKLINLLKEVKFPKEMPRLKDELDKVRDDANKLIHRVMFDNLSTQTINVKHSEGSFSVKKKRIGSIQKSAISAIRASTRTIEVFFV